MLPALAADGPADVAVGNDLRPGAARRAGPRWVDVVEGPDGPLLIELDLIEPCLFLDLVPEVVTGRVARSVRAAATRRAASLPLR